MNPELCGEKSRVEGIELGRDVVTEVTQVRAEA
jgi:hypothetical protein